MWLFGYFIVIQCGRLIGKQGWDFERAEALRKGTSADGGHSLLLNHIKEVEAELRATSLHAVRLPTHMFELALFCIQPLP